MSSVSEAIVYNKVIEIGKTFHDKKEKGIIDYNKISKCPNDYYVFKNVERYETFETVSEFIICINEDGNLKYKKRFIKKEYDKLEFDKL